MRIWTIEGTCEDPEGMERPYSMEILGDEYDPTEAIATAVDLIKEEKLSKIKVKSVESGIQINAVTTGLLGTLKDNNGRDVEG